MSNDLTLQERETHFNICAYDRTKILVYSDDPVWIKKLDKISTGQKVGYGKEYVLDASQLTVREKREPTPKQLEALDMARKKSVATGFLEP